MTSNKFHGLVDASFSGSTENKHIDEANFSQEVSNGEVYDSFNTKETSKTQTPQREAESFQCPSHPDEELQFYCFNNFSLVCAQCLVSGNYTGMEIANLKKASEKIKEKLTSVQTQLADQCQVSSKLQEDVKTTEAAIETSIDQYKNDIKSKIETIRQIIDQKEQEILHKLDNIKEERLKKIKGSPLSTPTNKDEVKELEVILAKDSSKANDLNLCRYYSKKAHALIPLKETKKNSGQNLLKWIDSFNTEDSNNFAKLKEDYQSIVKALQSFGEGLKSYLDISIELNEGLEQILESTKSKLKSISYSENANNRDPQAKIDLLRKYSSRETTSEQPKLGTNLALKIKNTSSFLNQNNSVERDLTNRSKIDTRLYTESDKDSYSILVSNRNKTPPSSRKIDIIGAYKDQLSKIAYTKEKSSSTRALKTEGDEDRSSMFRSSDRMATKQLVESLLSSQPGKKTAKTPVHYSYNTFLDVKIPGKTVSDLLLQSRQDASQTTKAGSRRNNYFSGAELDRIFSETKAPIREKPERNSSHLKSKLISFNFKSIN